jgi:hypothetical protein
MPGFLAIVLVCAASIAGSDCTPLNAADVVTQPVLSAPECMKVGETIAAQSFGPPPAGFYHKVGCERRKVS